MCQRARPPYSQLSTEIARRWWGRLRRIPSLAYDGALAVALVGEIDPERIAFRWPPASGPRARPEAVTDVESAIGGSDGSRRADIVGERSEPGLVSRPVDEPVGGLVAVPQPGLLTVGRLDPHGLE
jgi:hypothetical protein